MQTISVNAYAKINLSLHVLNKRPDGYHNIESVMQPVDFGDVLSLSKTEKQGIYLSSDSAELPLDEKNIVYRAAELMQKTYELLGGVSIHIHKRIPIAAGLAGGSTDAAATLKGMCRLYNMQHKSEELLDLGLKLGADVPFCLYEKPALVEGIGERLTPVIGLSNCYILLVNPGVGVSTAAIYEALDGDNSPRGGNTQALLFSLKNKDFAGAFCHMNNEMEPVTKKFCPAISELLESLLRAGAAHSMMSGSGATCFGIFTEKPDEEKLKEQFGKSFVALTRPIF